MTDSGALTGRLLVATPALDEPPFHRTVLLLLAHGDSGALGVVLNRPSTTALADVLPQWDPLAAVPPVVFIGGPVGEGSAIGIGRVRAAPPEGAWAPVSDDLGTLDLDRAPDDLGGAVEEARVFAGHAGWGPGQLEGEIAEGAWWVVDAWPGDAFHPEPAELWRLTLRRQGGALARVANFPPDLRLN